MRFADCFKKGQQDHLSRSFRFYIMWRILKGEVQWWLLRFGLWWHRIIPTWLIGGNKRYWDEASEQVLEVKLEEDEIMLGGPQGYLSHDEVERFERPL